MKPPKNFRYKSIRTCWNCKYRVPEYNSTIIDGEKEASNYVCQRDPDGISWDTAELRYIEQVCDRWRSDK